jgi:hypothetical protein
MKITAEELLNEMRQGKATQERRGDLTFKTHETSITWKIHSSIRTTDQTQEEVLHLGEEEGEENPRNSQTITQEIHTSTANITEEVTAPKGAQKPRRTSLEFNKRNHDEHCLHNVEPTSPKLLATTVHEFSTKSSHNATVPATTAILETFSAVLSLVSGNSIN